MAAVMATMSGSSPASLTSSSENTCVHVGVLALGLGVPVAMSKGPTPWNNAGLFSAGP